MSIQAVGWVLDHSTAELGARLALLSIANHADKEGGNSFVGYASIAQEARFSERAAYAAVERLVRDGHVVRVNCGGGRKHPNGYALVGMPGAINPEASFIDVGAGNPEVSSSFPRETLKMTDLNPEDDASRVPNEPKSNRKTRTRARTTRACALPSDWQPSDDLLLWTTSEAPSVNVSQETAKFRDHWLGNGKPMKDWDATFRNWIRRAPQFSGHAALVTTNGHHPTRSQNQINADIAARRMGLNPADSDPFGGAPDEPWSRRTM